MTIDIEIAKIANLMGDKTRAAILMALMAGKALTAGEIALRAQISPQTASNHLKKLTEAKLIELVPTPTRYRYCKIASPLVAKALESLSLLTPVPLSRPPRHEKLDKAICFARTCYDHLAGELGVAITKRLISFNFLRLDAEDFSVTDKGMIFLNNLGIDCGALQQQRRHFAKACLDWTEREYHIAGSLGHALLEYQINNGLLVAARHKPRAMLLTTKGRLWLKANLEIE
jgi:DNA-binding transcriptional ArsR family regulator